MKKLIFIILLFPNLTLSQTKVNSYGPKWSPDGSRIVFYSNNDGDFEIYTINRDGTNMRRITVNDNGDSEPSWSPDGNKILFNSNRDGSSQLYEYTLQTAEIKKLTHTDGRLGAGAFSPSGRLITFECRLKGTRELCIMNSDGVNIKNLTNNAANDFSSKLVQRWQAYLFQLQKIRKLPTFQNEK